MASADPPADADLASLRGRIDALDRRLLALLNERAGVAVEIGEIKRGRGAPPFDPRREALVIDALKGVNAGPLRDESIASIWREVMSACRALEAPTRVAFLGPAGTFSELALLGYFGAGVVRLPCANADEVFHATAAGAADFGIVPVENSSEGVVTRSLDLFLSTPLVIVGETSLAVRHNLLRRTESLDAIAAVCAHPQALAQCHAWLSHHLPAVERRPVASNAEGARLASLDGSLAALASERAASEWGLAIVARAVQDDATNRTRFAVIARPGQLPPSAPSGNDCTSLVVSVANRPGAVHAMLKPLAAHGVSMTRFESRPARSGQWEYYFYVDLEGHPEQPNVASALRELREVCAFFKLLGAYPVDKH